MTSSPPSPGFIPAVPYDTYNIRQGLRSLPDLTGHLTTRADDSHAAPVMAPRRVGRLSDPYNQHVKPRQGSSRSIELNHTLRCLCGNPSIPLSFNLAVVIPRRQTYRVSYGTDGFYTTNTKFASFTAWTTGVSNPVCYPCFRVLASGTAQKAAFATGIPPDIYAFHHYTRNSTFLYRPLVW